MKKLIVLCGMIVMCCFAFAKGKESIYVGTNPEFFPFEYLENGKMKGFDVELMEKIGDKIDKEIKWKEMAFDGLLPALQSKKLDVIIAGMTATDDRKKFVNFSDAYYTSTQMILVNKNTDDINSLESMKGKTAGVILGYTGDVAVSKIDGVKVKRYNGAGEGVMALKANKVDAVVLDSEPAKNYVKKNKELKLIETNLAKEEYAIAISKENNELTKEINNALNELVKDGTYKKLMKKYFN
ncbi:basic amino acid ABC transporter substrate-binding protein [Fusobacterium sp. MFO224]|uniref:basic amino acid ABC transporter substrate-binding protein n=1 Tax=Fusobacterium sp. MFO224 TaxID=3378070 RepID=UPI003852AEBD